MKRRASILGVFSIIALFTVVCVMLQRPGSAFRADALIYRCAAGSFWHDAAPYSIEEQASCQGVEDPAMVWNPPLFFVSYGTLFLLPPALIAWIIPAVSVSATTALAAMGLAAARCPPQARMASILAVLASLPPLIIEADLNQFSSLVALTTVLGYVLLVSQRDLLAGAVLALGIAKPHVVAVPGLYLFLHCIFARRWRVFLGGAACLLTLSLLAEAVHQGITHEWINRRSWPSDYYGATLFSALRALSHAHLGYDPSFLAWCIPLITAGAFIAVGRLCMLPTPEAFALLCGANFLGTPYGYLFDQCLVAYPLAYLLGRRAHLPSDHLLRMFAPCAVWSVYLVGQGIRNDAPAPSWFAVPCTVLALWWWHRRIFSPQRSKSYHTVSA
jgi:hypothetical protein